MKSNSESFISVIPNARCDIDQTKGPEYKSFFLFLKQYWPSIHEPKNMDNIID